MKTRYAVVLCAVALPLFAQVDEKNCPLHEQHTAETKSPYVANTANAVKALSPETLDAYRKGTGMGLAIPAELNGYPGPRHILDLGEQLHLTPEQRGQIEKIYAPMHEEALRLGAEIIDFETKLDAAFAQGTITPQSLRTMTDQIAARQGRLRYAHLAAHIAAKSVLTAEQVAAYETLRGYNGAAGAHQHQHGS